MPSRPPLDKHRKHTLDREHAIFSIILTWLGTVLGFGVLVAVALGTFVIDLDDAFGNRPKQVPEMPESTVVPFR